MVFIVGLKLLRSKLFYCLRLPIQSNARGGDLNSMLGVIVVLGVNAAYFQSLHETT